MICLSKVKTKINNIEGVFMANATDNYKVINTKGLSIDEVVKQLHSQTGVKTEFNGKWLNSDMTEDDVYVALTGNTKAELEVMRKKHIEERKRKEREAKEKLPERIAEYKEKGKKLVPESKMAVWCKIVSESLSKGIYDGSDLNAVLALLPYISKENWGKAKAIFKLQAHSGNSASTVFSELRTLLSNTAIDVDGFISYLKS